MNIAEHGLSNELSHLGFNGQGGAGSNGEVDHTGDSTSDEGNADGPGAGAIGAPTMTGITNKKKKKKPRAKKPVQASDAEIEAGRIKISRNKHMRFISSYHVRRPLDYRTISK